MSILVIGALGNMGSRYKGILESLGKEVEGVDQGHNRFYIRDRAKESEGIVIATPTDSHLEYISLLSDLGKPILCEKPLGTDAKAVSRVLEVCEDRGTNLTMVYQYFELTQEHPASEGVSLYNFYKHGNDGLVWDCIQIIALARSKVLLSESSQEWMCTINGQALSLDDMKGAYVKMMKRWLEKPGHSLKWLNAIHKKTAEFKKGFDRAANQ